LAIPSPKTVFFDQIVILNLDKFFAMILLLWYTH
jgi:hypothetical protein